MQVEKSNFCLSGHKGAMSGCKGGWAAILLGWLLLGSSEAFQLPIATPLARSSQVSLRNPLAAGPRCVLGAQRSGPRLGPLRAGAADIETDGLVEKVDAEQLEFTLQVPCCLFLLSPAASLPPSLLPLRTCSTEMCPRALAAVLQCFFDRLRANGL